MSEDYKSVASFLPEGFYDLFTYVGPGYILLWELKNTIHTFPTLGTDSISTLSDAKGLGFAFIAIFISYCLGQINNTFSGLLLYRFIFWHMQTCSFWECFNPILLYNKFIFHEKNTEAYLDIIKIVRENYTPYFYHLRTNPTPHSMELVKQYTRVNLSRGMTTACILIYLGVAAFNSPAKWVHMYAVLGAVFFIDSYTRVLWISKDFYLLDKKNNITKKFPSEPDTPQPPLAENVAT